MIKIDVSGGYKANVDGRVVGDHFLSHDLRLLWNSCFEQRQPPDVIRLAILITSNKIYQVHIIILEPTSAFCCFPPSDDVIDSSTTQNDKR